MEMFKLMLHARLTDDVCNNKATKRELQLHREVWTSFEPEVV